MYKKIICLVLGVCIFLSSPLKLNSYSITNQVMTQKYPNKKKENTKPRTDDPEKPKKKKKKTAKQKRIEKLENTTGRKIKSYVKVECTLSYYTDLPQENGGYTITACGDPLEYGVIANNSLSFGTNVYFEGMGTFEVKDRGCSNFNTANRYDVFIPRNYGESDSAYYTRVNNLGKTKVTGYIIEYE